MPALTSITVQDRETTPVDHIYVPSAPDGDVQNFRVASGVPFGAETLSISSRITATGIRKVQVRLVDPVIATETINGVDSSKFLRDARITVSLSFAAESTLQERQNAVGKTANLLSASQAFMNLVLTDLEGMY